MNGDGIYYIYDGACPLCRHSALAVKLKGQHGGLHLINARSLDASDPISQYIEKHKLDLDKGMVIIVNYRHYYGPLALHFMARQSEPQNIVQSIIRIVFSSRLVCLIAYPILRLTRNMLLRYNGVAHIKDKKRAS